MSWRVIAILSKYIYDEVALVIEFNEPRCEWQPRMAPVVFVGTRQELGPLLNAFYGRRQS